MGVLTMTDFKAINRAAFEWMTNRWNDGMTVCITNRLRSVQIAPKRREAVRISASGDLQIQAGKRWDTVLVSGVKVTAFK